ncbi:MAG: 2,3-cyclic 3-phosphodiesterase [Fusobacteriaceae bacterium]|jgi:2'-5' RNA ligase|nr:2,3-cyclic 3-phosphodiesterase [Fusobacteriaceae bacterium]
MRCFIALDVDENFKKECIKLQKELKKFGIKGSYVKANNFHLTLRFFRNAEEKIALEIIEKLEKTLKEKKEFKISLREKLSMFIRKDGKSIVWLGIKENKEKIKSIAKELFDITNNYVLEDKDVKNFKPHFSLLRTKISTKEDEENIIKIIESFDLEITTKIKSISLYKSELTPNGPVYSKLYRIKLEKAE